MGITYGDHLIDSGYYDITPEQEREIETRDLCPRCRENKIDPVFLGSEGHICGLCWQQDRYDEEYPRSP